MPIAQEKDMRWHVRQADIIFNQVNPVSGTEYEVLPTTTFVRIIAGLATVTWTVQPTPLEWRLNTIDGITETFDFTNPVSTTLYYPAQSVFNRLTANENQILETDFLTDGLSIRVAAEITGGTVQSLGARVRYSRYV